MTVGQLLEDLHKRIATGQISPSCLVAVWIKRDGGSEAINLSTVGLVVDDNEPYIAYGLED